MSFDSTSLFLNEQEYSDQCLLIYDHNSVECEQKVVENILCDEHAKIKTTINLDQMVQFFDTRTPNYDIPVYESGIKTMKIDGIMPDVFLPCKTQVQQINRGQFTSDFNKIVSPYMTKLKEAFIATNDNNIKILASTILMSPLLLCSSGVTPVTRFDENNVFMVRGDKLCIRSSCMQQQTQNRTSIQQLLKHQKIPISDCIMFIEMPYATDAQSGNKSESTTLVGIVYTRHCSWFRGDTIGIMFLEKSCRTFNTLFPNPQTISMDDGQHMQYMYQQRESVTRCLIIDLLKQTKIYGRIAANDAFIAAGERATDQDIHALQSAEDEAYEAIKYLSDTIKVCISLMQHAQVCRIQDNLFLYINKNNVTPTEYMMIIYLQQIFNFEHKNNLHIMNMMHLIEQSKIPNIVLPIMPYIIDVIVSSLMSKIHPSRHFITSLYKIRFTSKEVRYVKPPFYNKKKYDIEKMSTSTSTNTLKQFKYNLMMQAISCIYGDTRDKK